MLKSQASLRILAVRHDPKSTRGRESLQPLLVSQSEFDEFGDFDVCPLVANKAMHDQDYQTRFEGSAYGHVKALELSQLELSQQNVRRWRSKEA